MYKSVAAEERHDPLLEPVPLEDGARRRLDLDRHLRGSGRSGVEVYSDDNVVQPPVGPEGLAAHAPGETRQCVVAAVASPGSPYRVELTGALVHRDLVDLRLDDLHPPDARVESV